VGHGPFSHTLEHTLIQVHHETLSLLFMERLNEQFRGQLDLAIRIFRNEYHKPFLHQLVSGQLDMDRMDYLTRDSYFTGVSEGVIGYDRIIKMLNVRDNQLVVEQKGIYSIEKFLIARRLMYWQVYLHKTVLAAELMLVKTLQRVRELVQRGENVFAPPALAYFLHHAFTEADFRNRRDELLEHFSRLDDTDIASAIKAWQTHGDAILAYLSWGLANRKLFRLRFYDDPVPEADLIALRQKLARAPHYPAGCAAYFIITGQESNTAYSTSKDEILILTKEDTVLPMSQVSDFGIGARSVTKYYVAYPKELD
jgi:HD superfamily phosphohydrolase